MNQKELRGLWEEYELTRDTELLAAFVEAHLASLAPCQHKWPKQHRICEVRLRGKTFCVTRCIGCDGRLAFKATDMTHDAPGVPYWLEGAMLAQWVADEIESPSKGPVDWERYDLSSQGKVSLWLGNFTDRKMLEAYLDESASHAGDAGAPLNQFAAEFGIGYYDHDFQDAYLSEEGALPLDELLTGISFGDSFLARAVEAGEKAGWQTATAFVLLYDLDYSRRRKPPNHASMAFIGAFDYQKR